MIYSLIYKTCATQKDAERELKKLPEIISGARVEFSKNSTSYLVIICESYDSNQIVDIQQKYFKAGISCFIKVKKGTK